MKKIIFGLILVLVLSIVNAQNIEVYIGNVLDLEILSFKHTSELKSYEPFKVGFEILNSGSLGYRARVRLDIIKNNETIYTGWSNEVPLWPGDSQYFELFWYSGNVTGDFIGKVKIYHANEIKELEPINIKIKGSNTPEKNIQITSFKTLKDKVEVKIKSSQELKDIIIIPSGYPYGWIFEQSKIDSINQNEEKKIVIKYEPTIWEPTEVEIHVFTEDGNQYTSKSFLMKRQKPSTTLITYFAQILKKFVFFLF